MTQRRRPLSEAPRDGTRIRLFSSRHPTLHPDGVVVYWAAPRKGFNLEHPGWYKPRPRATPGKPQLVDYRVDRNGKIFDTWEPLS